ncbi:unnamed protein product [Leptosia nina]|uniref:Uncharacterized protein n=1 Tax=Leptosia nina TaxID=320188 RepID=A0AAV1J5F1_9NEOP
MDVVFDQICKEIILHIDLLNFPNTGGVPLHLDIYGYLRVRMRAVRARRVAGLVRARTAHAMRRMPGSLSGAATVISLD